MNKETHSSTENFSDGYSTDQFEYIASREYRKIRDDQDRAHGPTKAEGNKLTITIIVFSFFVWGMTGHISIGIGSAIFAIMVYGSSLVHTLPGIIRDNHLPSEKCKSAFFHGVLATVIFFMLLWMLVSQTNSQRKCHPNCRWCEESIDEYNEETRQEHYDPRY